LLDFRNDEERLFPCLAGDLPVYMHQPDVAQKGVHVVFHILPVGNEK
jgi:hypothetical protein